VNNNWKDDLKWSSKAFQNLVWPHLKNFLNGRLIFVEQITKSDFARDLDSISGIDAWHIIDDTGIRGIASRVQVCPPPQKPFNTFTIRKSRDSGVETEYQKRLRCFNSKEGWLYPVLTVQAYITQKENPSLLSFAIAYTKDIFNKIKRGDYFVKKTYNAEFYCIKWNNDFCLFIYP